MALAHTILALLAKRPGSGYDITKHFEEGLSCYWKATQQQVYRELSKLTKEKKVSFETLPQAGKPDKKLYQITAAGWQELIRWYAEPTEPTDVREDVLVKILIGYKMPRELVVKEISHRQALHRAQLAFYREKEAEHFQQQKNAENNPSQLNPEDLERQFMYLTLKRGIAYETSWLTWCDEVMAVLEQSENLPTIEHFPDEPLK